MTGPTLFGLMECHDFISIGQYEVGLKAATLLLEVGHVMAKPKRRWRRELDEIEILLPVNGLSPVSACPHDRDISRGQYCPVCDRLKLRTRHYRLRRDPREDPKPEPKKKCAPELPGGTGSTKAKAEWELPGVGKVKAWTKSEARAAFKVKLGVERLPVGSKVRKIEA